MSVVHTRQNRCIPVRRFSNNSFGFRFSADAKPPRDKTEISGHHNCFVECQSEVWGTDLKRKSHSLMALSMRVASRITPQASFAQPPNFPRVGVLATDHPLESPPPYCGRGRGSLGSRSQVTGP